MSEVDINLEYEALLATPDGVTYLSYLREYENKLSPHCHDDEWWLGTGNQPFFRLMGVVCPDDFTYNTSLKFTGFIEYVYKTRKLGLYDTDN